MLASKRLPFFLEAIQRLDHVDRKTDRAAVVGDRPRDGLANPPRRVRRELEPAAELESIDRLHQTEVAFLDEIQE